MGAHRFQKIGRKRLLVLSITVACIAFVLLCRWNADVAEWYMQNVYPIPATVLSYLSSLFPFSLFDVLTIAAIGLLIFSIIQLLRRRLSFLRWLYYLAMSILWVVLWFYLSWGIGYFRPDYYSRSEISTVNIGVEDFFQTSLRYIDSLNKHHVSIAEIDKDIINEAVEKSYELLHEELNLPYPNGKRNPKRTIYQPLQTKVGVTGFFGPFFNEVHVNTDALPFTYPFTLAHEKAHQLGITSEAECNLYATISCIASENPQVRYSGYYELVSYLLSALRKVSPELYAEALERISPETLADFTREHEFWRQAINPELNELQTKAYDSYLKGNRVSSGIASYSEVVELFLAWEHHQGKQCTQKAY